MKRTASLLTACALLVWMVPTFAGNIPREDVIWARTATGPIILDGVLSEAEWAKAESKTVVYETDSGIPGSGWKTEAGAFFPPNPVTATFRFLVVDNQLYMGVEIIDASVGGSTEFNRFDGLLMAIKDHADPGAPKPPAEYFYAWWNAEGDPDPQPAGQDPFFIGKWATWPPGTPRTVEEIENWDAATVVNGLANDDSVVDQGYTVEMRFNLTPMGYDVTQPGGDIIEWNASVYDCDWFWPFSAPTFSSTRVWWQSPWGNAAWYSEVRVFARPDVTVDTGVVPFIAAEVVVPELSPTPTIDGQLTESVWTDPGIYEFDITWDDQAVRDTYPQVGPYRGGQFQPEVEGGTAFVIDPADATVKMFFEGDWLYLGFDARDQVIQYSPVFDKWDGFLVTINDRAVRGADNELEGRRLSFQVGSDGSAVAQDYLLTLVSQGDAQVATFLPAGSSPDTLGIPDVGYQAELAIDLKSLGYPPGLGDRALFIGVNHLDGDSFIPVTDSYGTRTWWYREYESECCAAWAHLDPAALGVDPEDPRPRGTFVRSYPNPSHGPTIQYSLSRRSRVTLEVYDLRGRLVSRREMGVKEAGIGDLFFNWEDRATGVYLYQLKLADPVSGTLRETVQGKTVLVK